MLIKYFYYVWILLCYIFRVVQSIFKDKADVGTSIELCDNADASVITTTIPKSVNYHLTRKCNYKCAFCFHTAKTSFMLNLDNAKRGLLMLKEAGMQKINFSGGEPFLPENGRFLGELTKYCKEELKLPSVTIVSNGSLIREKWFQKYGEFLDIMAISCDSFDCNTNNEIGRTQSKNRPNKHIEQLYRIKSWCEKYGVLLKINTVVNTLNYLEDMNAEINSLNPVRWKVFQCLLIGGENAGTDDINNALPFCITREQFEQFLHKHKNIKQLVPESNDTMRNSYLILDEYMRFLDCTSGYKLPSKSILDVGVEEALKFSGFDEVMFKKRGGIYKWSKPKQQDLEW